MAEYKFSSDWITDLETYNRWNLYWQQQKLLHNSINQSDKIAEIGVGTKFTYNYLKSKGYNVTSIDIDPDKNPDILLNIVECDPSQLKFDTILAFNIFEHIPFEEFLSTIDKFSSADISNIFFSVPLNKKILFEFKLRIGRYLNKEIVFDKRRNKITAEHHHWELDYKEYTKHKLVAELSQRNYDLENSFTFSNQAYFYFQKIK
jgi:hypothetical protein